MARASSADRDYFARVARGNRAIADDVPPASLAEMFDRLDRMRRSLGELARPGVAGDSGDLPEHLAFLERVGTLARRGEKRP